MNCAETNDLFAAHIEGLLDSATGGELAVHLETCARCRLALDETERLFDHLSRHGRVSPRPSINDAVMERIVREHALHLRVPDEKKPDAPRHAAAAEASACPPGPLAFSSRRSFRTRSFRIAAGAACLFAIGFVVLQLHFTPGDRKIYADELSVARKQGLEAKVTTWKTSYYRDFRSQDSQQKKWIRAANSDQECSYRSPGLYRVVTRNQQGEISFITTEDIVSRSKLEVNPMKKTATLRYLAQGSFSQDGPFATALGMLQNENLRFLGKKQVGSRTANGFRLAFVTSARQKWSYDVWIDAETKRLVLWQVPGADLFNPLDILDSGPGRDPLKESFEADGMTWVRNEDGASGGVIMRDIAFDEELDESFFSLKAPDGFVVTTVDLPPIKESDVVEFMRVVAEYFDGRFPEAMPRFNDGPKEYERFARIERNVLAKMAATPAEVKMVEAMHRWWNTGIPGPGPLHVFLQREIVEGSWKYLGAGVELGNQSHIVCWYRLKGSPKYRVISGDLSIRDVAPEDLPLPVERPGASSSRR